MPSRLETLQIFVNFCKEHIQGDEKGEAQSFLNEFFRAFDYAGALQAGAVFEERIKKGSKKGKTGFADLVWKPRVLVEMKKRGTDLSKHYSQAFDYWQRAVPDRPRYVMLCNFDEFWIYDFDIQIDTPVDMIPLEQLPERISAFAFMEKGDRKPIFRNNQVEVTEKAARRMGELLVMLQKRGIDKLSAQHLVLQCVLAMFAEDRNLLPDSLFVSCIQDCLGGKSSYDVLSALFREMNQPGITPAGQFKGVDYFNGGLFATVHPIELEQEELKMLEVSALEDWSKVRPAIFGSIFESAIDEKERHAHGIHYTSEADIMKIVRPTISRYWEERIDSAANVAQLEALQLELQNYRVLDPACGSGNFLYIAYQELKQIEQLLLDKLAARRRSPREQMQMSFVTPNQFFGIDNNQFAVELARVTMMIARKVAIDRLGLFEPALPLDTLDDNIICQDALFTEWPKTDAIIGNPPFLGGNRIRGELGDLYTDKLLETFSDVIDQVDFCTYWFRTTHSMLSEGARAGLVATDRITQGRSRVAALDYITKNSGVIHEAISSQEWSGDAQVKVSIVNWSREYASEYYLDNEKVGCINSALRSSSDLSISVRLNANKDICLEGVKPAGKGFFVDEDLVAQWTTAEPKNSTVLRKLCDASDLAKSPNAAPTRWVIDFNDMTIEEASSYKFPFEHIKQKVKPERDKNRRDTRRLNWWKYGENSPKMRNALSVLDYFFAIPRHSKYFIFLPIDSNTLINDSAKALVLEDYFIFGILTSDIHRIWAKAQSSRLGPSLRYTPRSCLETFPFPQSPTLSIISKIKAQAVKLQNYRSEQMEKKQWGLTTLYNAYFDEPASQLYKLHNHLNNLVAEAYGFNDSDDILERLLEMNLELADKEKRGEAVAGPQHYQ